MSDDDEKLFSEGTLASFFGDEEVETKSIDLAQMHANRRLGRRAGRRIMNSLERFKQEKAEKKK